MDQTLYHKIADQVESQIREGLFRVGSKIPSVRKASSLMDVSMTTVLQAYRLLEDRGVIKAQPQKGYFVQTVPRSQHLVEDIVPQQRLLDELSYRSQDPTLIQLASALPHSQFLPTRQLQRAVGRVMRLEPDECSAHNYPQGLPALQRQIAIRMLDTGCQLNPDSIMMTLGCQNAILLALQAITQAGDTIVIESPTYDGIHQLAKVLKLNTIELPCTKTGLDLEALSVLCKVETIRACVITPNHQNPTGACMPLAQRRALITLAQQHNFDVVEDDVYGELTYQDERRTPSLASLDIHGRVFYCSSFSKTIAPAFRVGWLIAPAQHEAAIQAYAAAQFIAVPTLPQQALANFLQSGSYDRHLRKTRMLYADNAALFRSAIKRYLPAGIDLSEPQGGFLLWLALPNKINALKLYEASLDNAINILPGSVLSATGEHHHYVRINYAYPWSNEIELALKKIGQLCFTMLD